MDKKQCAIEYSLLGWQVFPLAWVTDDGKCSCGSSDCSIGKHPLTHNGLLDATDNASQINKWWSRWPLANIGVRTGEESGIVVIDIDDMSQRSLLDIPKTVSQVTGSGGEHHIFSHPGKHVKSVTGVRTGIDSRGDGGYIIVPPSNHVEGNYFWVESPFDGCDLADCPQWWLDEVTESKKKTKTVQQAPDSDILEGGRNEAVFKFGCSIWKAVPATVDILYASMSAYNLAKCKPPLDDSEVMRTAESIVKYDGMSHELYKAYQDAPIDAERIRQSHHEKIAKALITRSVKTAGPPPDFMPESGVIRDFAEYILSQSERPMPQMAVAASACFFGALFGRKFETWTGLGTNLMVVCLAESGRGKEKARKIINKISGNHDLLDYIGADDIASSPGLIAELVHHPSKMFMLDEFGLALQSITSKSSASSKREIISTMMKLYSSYGGYYNGTAYADQKNRPKVRIKNPCLVIYGTSTHQTFYDSLTHDQGSDGFIARLLVLPCGMERPIRVEPNYHGLPGTLKAKIMELGGMGGQDTPIIVNATPEVKKAYIDLDESFSDYMTDPKSSSIYSRVAENAIKLALVHCLSNDWVDPVIDWKDFVWGRDIALWCANYILEKMEEYVASNDIERWQKKLILAVKSSGEKGLSRRELLRKCHGLTAFMRDDILKTLDDMGYFFTKDGMIYHSDQKHLLTGEENAS